MNRTPAQKWQDLTQQISQVTDRLGMPIDPLIFNLVVALNALGVITTASCEGHLDHGTPAPWVDFYTKGTEQIQAQYQQLLNELEQAEQQNATQDQLNALHSDLFRFSRQTKITNFQGPKLIHDHLTTFYTTRSTPYDAQLMVRADSFGNATLQPLGIDIQPLRSHTEQVSNLKLYQAEAHDFALFLKDLFLHT